MEPLKFEPMPGYRRDKNGEPLLDKDGTPLPLIDPNQQQRIMRAQDGVLVGYVCFNREPVPHSKGVHPPNTGISIILPPSKCPAGFINHVEEFVKSEFPDAPPLRTAQVPEYKPEAAFKAMHGEDDDDE